MLQAEYERLKENLLSKTSVILKLDPYYDKRTRLLRVRGRLQYSDLPEGRKHPIILPHGHPAVKEMIQSVHKELLHAGPESTLSVLRQAIGSPRDAVKLREFRESALFVNVNASAHVLKPWPHYCRSGCHRLQPSLMLE